jgi:hypothetical protein
LPLLTLTLGWWWGAIPAYCATVSLALYAGMPLPWALLFGLANPLGFGDGDRLPATAMRRDLRGVAALLFYVQQSFVAACSAPGALIWSYTNRYDRTPCCRCGRAGGWAPLCKACWSGR